MKKLMDVEFTNYDYYKWYLKNRSIYAETIADIVYDDELTDTEVISLIMEIRNEC